MTSKRSGGGCGRRSREVEQTGWRSPRCNDIDSNASYQTRLVRVGNPLLFIRLFVRLASLHALRPRFSSFFWPRQASSFLSLSLSLARYFIQLFLLVSPSTASCNLSIVPFRTGNPQAPLCKNALTNRSMAIDLESVSTRAWCLIKEIVADVK